MEINDDAKALNEEIINGDKNVYDLLSRRGKEIFFPKKGILSQTTDAIGKSINATIGVAINDDGSPMRLGSVEKSIKLPPNDVFLYAPSFGKKDLRVLWQKKILEQNPSIKEKDISLPVVTNALTHALSITGYLFVNEGDEIIMPDLYWENYDLIFQNGFGAKIKTFKTFDGNRFNVDGLKNALAGNGKKILLLNFPNNPTGYSPTEAEAEEIKDVILDAANDGAKLVVIVDDAYFGLVYEKGIFKESMFSILHMLNDNILTIKIDGATKEDYAWGLRVGFITYGFKGNTKSCSKALETKTAGAIRGNISNASNLSQSLMLKAYGDPNYSSQKQKNIKILNKRYLEVKKVLEQNHEYNTYFEALPFNSGYFMCVKLNNSIDPEKLRRTLLEEYDTGLIFLDDIIRISFSSLPKKDIPKLFKNIFYACKKSGKNE